ncbi:NUDIX hydrolase [Paenibacillus sp. UNC451MF]|uniref:NUDIX hydrolase n=1 Tax=Paenibacillus sp. UNC451MF TaxID=1449063 RepID=UPI000490329B|nr:8-oxo-dGTP diphosphatase [Paenibacillus sp. UNC451MF]
MRLKYNLCFIRKGDQLLMLNRHKSPLLGLWNGVGGKLELEESPYASVLREVREETGILLPEAQFGGIVTWEVDGKPSSGMYVYIAEMPDGAGAAFDKPLETDEGILSLKPIEWVIHPDNQGVAVHVRHFLPPMLNSEVCREYRCIFRQGKLIECLVLPLEESYAVGGN